MFENCTSSFSLNETEVIQDYTSRPDWIIPMTVTASLMVATLYVTISLVHYGTKTRKWSSFQTNDVEKLNAGIIYSLVLVCSVSCLFRFAVNIVHMNIGFEKGEDQLCEAVLDTDFFAHSLVLYSEILFLWFRQRAFYRNAMMSFHTTKFVKVLSVLSIVIISTCALGYSLYACLPDNFKASNQGCVYQLEDGSNNYGVYASIVLITAQLMLLYLFIHPLRRKSTKCFDLTKVFPKRKDTSVSVSQSSNIPAISRNVGSDFGYFHKINHQHSFSVNPFSHEVKLIMRKTVIIAFITTIMDVAAQLLLVFTGNLKCSLRYSYMVFDITVFLHLLFLILTFVTYREILTSLFNRKENPETHSC